MAATRFSILLLRALQSHRVVGNVSRVAEKGVVCSVGHWNRQGTSWSQYTTLRRLSTEAGQNEHTSTTESASKGLKLSDSCVKQLKKVINGDEDSMLRIIVEGGGCSGFQYKFDLDTKCSHDDRVFERDGAKVVIDELSLSLLEGSIIDYEQELIRSSFRIIDNPNAELGCSCGASFALK